MSRLTVYEKPPKARPGAAAPHQYRLLGKKVLITDEHGRWALLTPAEHKRLLAGLKPSDLLWTDLQARGFIAGAFDFDAAARRQFERGLLSWKGPVSHALALDGMTLETARSVVEFVFRCPGPQLTLELVFDDAASVWPVLWFIVQYARRKGEWSRRPVFLIARGAAMTPDQADFLRSHGVTRAATLTLDGAPDMKKAPPFRAQRARAVLMPGAVRPREWASWFEKWGFESVRLEPSSLDAEGASRFGTFHAEFLDWLVEHGEDANIRDEWATAFLAGRTWSLPGVDLLEQLAYDARGRVFTSEESAAASAPVLGEAGELRYQDLAKIEAASAVIAASHADNQPQCSQCVYRSYCTVAPSINQKLQGHYWGRTPDSAACVWQMGILDRFFGRLGDEKWLFLLNKWNVDMT